MSNFNCRNFLQPLLFATALALVLLAGGGAPVFAGSVTVTGGNGGTPGGAAPPVAANAGPNGDPSNTATATAGNGGAGGNGFRFCYPFQVCNTPPPAGGAGGDATATATTSISSITTATTATATSFGGTGGAGGSLKLKRYNSPYYSYLGGAGGVGGRGTSTAIASGAAPASATATSTGGTGGSGGFLRGSGGAGETATSTATAKSGAGSATATATATGGRGGVGGSGGGFGGDGGGASASSSATGGGAGTVVSKATAQAGAGGADGYSTNPRIDPWGYGGPAQAHATGVAVTGNVQANASAYGGWALVPGTAAFAQSEAKNSKGEVLTTASAPRDAGGGSPSAVTSTGVGSGSIILSPSESQVVSDAMLTLTGPPNHETIGEGAFSAGFSGGLLQQTYAATAVFDFKTSAPEALDLDVLSDKAVGIGFNSLELQVINLADNTPTTLLSETFSSLTGSNSAGAFFAPGHSISLPGELLAGSQSIEIAFSLSYWNSTGIAAGDSFGFAYQLVDPPALSAATIPEPSTWAMTLVGFAGLAFAGLRGSRGRRRLSLGPEGSSLRGEKS